MKIFGIGLQKTGTTTLGTCLKTLGFSHHSYDRKAIWYLRKGNYPQLKKIIDKFESFDDEPWARLYKLADQYFPDAKFILTVRKNSEVWFNSLSNHCDRIPFNEHRVFLFGSMFPRKHRNEIIQKYEKHNKEVIDYFKGREDKLLVISFDGENQSNAWEQICNFLELEAPVIPVPRKNAAPLKKYPTQTKLRVTFYLPKYLWIVLKRDYLWPMYNRIISR